MRILHTSLNFSLLATWNFGFSLRHDYEEVKCPEELKVMLEDICCAQLNNTYDFFSQLLKAKDGTPVDSLLRHITVEIRYIHKRMERLFSQKIEPEHAEEIVNFEYSTHYVALCGGELTLVHDWFIQEASPELRNLLFSVPEVKRWVEEFDAKHKARIQQKMETS
ncbi:MAG: hypothetical protein OEW23_12930 [Candidatus Aminicenantes bacterium]|nr:hypothetical protein [Candidatus Aminicenantes bacterium]